MTRSFQKLHQSS